MYVYEAIIHGEGYPARILTVSMEDTASHWHYDYEFVLVLKGQIVVIDDRGKHVLKEGDICLINTCIIHKIEGRLNENLCLIVQINRDLFHELGNDSEGRYYFYLNSVEKKHVQVTGYNKFIQILASLGCEQNEHKICNIYRIKALIYELIAELFEFVLYDVYMNVIDIMDGNDEKILQTIMTFLQHNYNENDALERLGREIGMGEKTLYRFVKKSLGMTPKDLLLETRLDAAKYLLINTRKSAGFIADNCGFGSESSFFRIFKEMYGMSPIIFRKNCVADEFRPYENRGLRFDKNEANRLLLYYREVNQV